MQNMIILVYNLLGVTKFHHLYYIMKGEHSLLKNTIYNATILNNHHTSLK